MASTSEKVDQDATLRFNLGDLVWARTRGHRTTFWLAVICPDFSQNDQYTFVAEKVHQYRVGEKSGRRYYHVQRLGQSFDHDWFLEHQLYTIKLDDVNAFADRSVDDCKMFMEKTNEERVEICSIRAKAKQNPADVRNYGELHEAKVQIELLKNELWRLKESMEDKETLKNDLKNLNESQNDIKKSMEDLKDVVMSQNQNNAQNEPNEKVTRSNHDSANAGNDEQNSFCFEQPFKKIKMEDLNEEIQRLNQIIKDLKEDNSKLSKENTKITEENAKLSKHNEEMQTQNEAMIKNLEEDRLKLARENVELKYGRGSRGGSF